MAKLSIFDWDVTAANDLDLNSISLAENVTKPSDVNSFEREHMSQIAKWRQDLGGAATTSGTNTITVTLASTFTAYATGQRFLVKLGGTNTGAATLNINSLGAKNIKVITGGVAGDPVAGALTSGNYAEFQYDGTNMNLLNPPGATGASLISLSNDNFYNLTLSATVGSNQLTLAIKDQAGADPSGSTVVNFRSATATSGLSAQLTLSSATSLVITNGSTLGTTSGFATTLAVAVFNDAGTARVGVINPTYLPFINGLASSTAEGGAGAADNAGVWYTGTAVTSKAYTIVGFVTITEATAGTWASGPTVVYTGTAPTVNEAVSSAYVQVRQTVLTGPVTTVGLPNFGGSTGGTTVTTSGVITATAAYGAFNRMGSALNPSWTGLSTNGTMYLYADIGNDGTWTVGSTTQAPVYQWGGTPATTSGLFTFNIQEMTGYVGNGSAAIQTWRVFIGQVTVAGNVVTAITWYALMGRYDSGYTATLTSTAVTTSFNHNIGLRARNATVYALCTTTDVGYAVGDEILPYTQASSGDVPFATFVTSLTGGFTTGSTAAWRTANKSTGAAAALTAASWSYRFTCERGW